MNDFHQVSAFVLEELANFFESSWPNADIDLLEDTLTVNVPKNRLYVINKHGVTRQIWVSSPFTGAHHFHLKEGQWKCTRTDTNLFDLIVHERDSYAAGT